MPRVEIAVFAALLGCLPAQAHSQTTWLCGLSTDAMRLVCVADAVPQEGQAPAGQPVAVINGTSFPLDPRRLYTVDLLTQATEMEFVEQLARSTMCYRTPVCTVAFTAPRTDVALADRRR
jgi:hypothetical protein